MRVREPVIVIMYRLFLYDTTPIRRLNINYAHVDDPPVDVAVVESERTCFCDNNSTNGTTYSCYRPCRCFFHLHCDGNNINIIDWKCNTYRYTKETTNLSEPW